MPKLFIQKMTVVKASGISSAIGLKFVDLQNDEIADICSAAD